MKVKEGQIWVSKLTRTRFIVLRKLLVVFPDCYELRELDTNKEYLSIWDEKELNTVCYLEGEENE